MSLESWPRAEAPVKNNFVAFWKKKNLDARMPFQIGTRPVPHKKEDGIAS